MKLQEKNYKYLIFERSSYLQWIKEVEDDLEEGTDNHSEEENNNQDDYVVVGIIFLSLSADSLHQEHMSINYVET